MHPVASNQKFVNASLSDITKRLNDNTPEVQRAILDIVGNHNTAAVTQQHKELLDQFAALQMSAAQEQSRGDRDFVSRVDLVGVYQSVLSAVFGRIPDLQGYGDKNPSWVATLIEEGVFRFGAFFKHVYEDVQRTADLLYLERMEVDQDKQGTISRRNTTIDHTSHTSVYRAAR